MTFVVEPLFIEWDKFSPSARSKRMLNNLSVNRTNWGVVEQGDEGQKAINTSKTTLFSHLDWERNNEDSEEGGRNEGYHLFQNTSSYPSTEPVKKGKSLSFSFSKNTIQLTTTEDKENHDPSRSMEVLIGEYNNNNNDTDDTSNHQTSVCSSGQSSSSFSNQKSTELRRLSLPSSSQPPVAISITQLIDKRRASLPLSRILELGGGQNDDENHPSSSKPLESLTEASPSHLCNFHRESSSQQEDRQDDRASLINNTSDLEEENLSPSDCVVCSMKLTQSSSISPAAFNYKRKNSDKNKSRFSFDLGKSQKIEVGKQIDRSKSFNNSGKKSSQKQQNQAPSQQPPDHSQHHKQQVLSNRRFSCPNTTPLSMFYNHNHLFQVLKLISKKGIALPTNSLDFPLALFCILYFRYQFKKSSFILSIYQMNYLYSILFLIKIQINFLKML